MTGVSIYILFREEDLDDITYNSIEELTEILSTIKTLILDKTLYLSIISSTNVDTVREIKELVTKGYITKRLLTDNIELFNIDNALLNIIKTNIELFNNYQLNPTVFSDIEEILLIDSNLLENNLRILESYNLIKSVKNSHNYSFIFNENISLLIDKYLELGYEELLETDLDILNYQDTRRVEILSNMGIVLNKEEFIEMFEYDKFFIPDEMLDDYIPNKIEVSGNFDITLEELLEYRKTTRTIEINGQLISINKILRAMDNNFNIKEAIFYNMNMNKDTYEEIESIVNGKVLII